MDSGALSLDRLGQLEAVLRRSQDALARAQRRLDHARSNLLLPPLAHRLDRVRVQVSSAERSADRAANAAHEAQGLLGAKGLRRYFLAMQTPSESRGSGGFMGSWAEITADGGRLHMTRLGRSDDLNRVGSGTRRLIAPPDYVARYSRFEPQALWQNVNVSPDFPSVAQVIEGLYPQSGGSPVDGVIAVDPDGLGALLQLTGPITVTGWPDPINAANAHQVLLYDQYARIANDDVRTSFLSAAAQNTWQRLTSATLPGVEAVVRTLGPAVAGKHILLSSTHASEQQLFHSMAADGALAASRGDFLGLITQNAGADKIDWFLRRAIDYQVHLNPATGSLQASVGITLRNQAPASGLPVELLRDPTNPKATPGENVLYLSVYTPWSLQGAKMDGEPLLMESEIERGLHVYSTYVRIPSMSSATLTLDLSGNAPRGDYRLGLFRQPTVAPDDVTTTINFPSQWTVPGARLGPAKTSQLSAHLLLDRDATWTVLPQSPA
jgi:hypothetical protein